MDDADGPVPLAMLADLQAGLLDDDVAAGLRRRAREDPAVASQLAALDRVRRRLADLGGDAESAPEPPADVSARIDGALRALPPPAVAGPARPRASRFRSLAAPAGIAAAIAAVAVGGAMLLRGDPTPGAPTLSTGSVSTMSRSPSGLPLSDEQIRALVDAPPDLGPLADRQRLASCLSGLGYSPSTPLLGGKPLDVNGRPGLLLLLPGDLPKRVRAVMVSANCSSVDTGLLASTVVTRP